MKQSLTLSLIAVLTAGQLHAQLALIRQGDETRGVYEDGDRMGSAVCAGDFNGDGYDDLAAGSPGERYALLPNAGFVTVNYGSSRGLSWTGPQGLGPAQGGLDEGLPHLMGAALASADFNADGCDDLAVGLPASAVSGNANAGRVLIFLGSGAGLQTPAALVLTQSAFGGANEAGDEFGASLAAGKLGTDNFADLVIGGPGENNDEGAVFIIRGAVGGLDVLLTKYILGTTAAAWNYGGRYGTSLAIGQLRDSAAPELAVGSPWVPVGPYSGVVFVHAGNSTSVNNSPSDSIDVGSDTTFNIHLPNSGFGYSLAIGRFNSASNYADPAALRGLAIGTYDNGSVSRAFMGSSSLLLHPGYGGTPADRSSKLGRSLTTGDFDGDGDDEIIAGRPLHTVPGTPLLGLLISGMESGGVQVWPHPAGSGATEPQSFDEADTAGVYSQGALGTALATGRFSGGTRQSIAAGCPGSGLFGVDRHGAVQDIAPWRQVRRPGCRAALSADCDDNVVYALRPFEQMKIASTTKIMTVLLGCEATARPANDPLRVGLNEYYTIEPWLASQFTVSSSCSKWVFTAGHGYKFHDLMRTCIMVSGNDSAFAIADAMTGEAFFWNGFTGTTPAFVNLMNQRAAQIGMNRTLFTNPPGVDTGDPYSTAWDMWLLGHTAMQNALFRTMVTDTSEQIVFKRPGDSDGIRTCTYGWLMGLQAQDSRVVGIKPGGTPMAGWTSVVAGVPANQPDKLAFGIGLGWFGIFQDESQRARVEILQLGLNACDPAPPAKFVGALFDAVWPLQDAARPSTAQGLIQPRGQGQRSQAVEFHLIRPSSLTATPPVEIKLTQDIRFDIPEGGSTELAMSGLVGHSGFLVRNTGDATVAVIVEAPGRTRVTLAPDQTHAISANAGLVSIKLTPDGGPADLTLSGICDVTPRWISTTFAPAVTTRLELPNHVVQHAWQLTACPLSNLAQPFPLRVIVDELFNGLTFPRVPEVDDFERIPTGPTDRVRLDFHGIPGLEPANGYDVQSHTALDGPWPSLARIVPAGNGQATYRWIGSVPAASRRFLKITPAP